MSRRSCASNAGRCADVDPDTVDGWEDFGRRFTRVSSGRLCEVLLKKTNGPPLCHRPEHTPSICTCPRVISTAWVALLDGVILKGDGGEMATFSQASAARATCIRRAKTGKVDSVRKKVWTPEIQVEAERLRAEGKTFFEVGQVFGVNELTARAWILKGHPRRASVALPCHPAPTQSPDLR